MTRPVAASSIVSCPWCGAALGHGEPRSVGRYRWLPDSLLAYGKKIHMRLWQADRAVRRRHSGRLDRIRKRNPCLGTDDMAIVCSYFNDAGYTSRLRNYLAFRENLQPSKLLLLTIELAFGDRPYELGEGPGELIQLRSTDVMWQKERLLNIGISTLLERGFKKIVWLDADIVFEDPETWAWQVAETLERTPLCQVFSEVIMETSIGAPDFMMTSAVLYGGKTGQHLFQPSRWPTWRRPLGLPRGTPGFGWAARADLLAKQPLYDRAIVGGGDSLIYAASFGAHRGTSSGAAQLFTSPLPRCPECKRQCDAPGLRDDYLAWADRWYTEVNGRVAHVDHSIRHLYHGELRHRGYERRRGYLLRHDFTPSRDLQVDDHECWAWKTDNRRLRTDVQRYLRSRREDGPTVEKET